MQSKQKGLQNDGRVPPYVSYRAWQNLLAELNTSIPLRFDPSYFDSLKITGSSRSMLKGTLLFLDLMSPDGVATEKLHQLVKAQGEPRRKVLEQIVRGGYESLFASLDVSRATLAQMRSHFNIQGDNGRKCLSFFCAIATEANIPLSPHIGKSKSRGRKKRDEDMPKLKAGRQTAVSRQSDEQPWERLLIDKFPNFDNAWPDEIKNKWFDAFKWLKTTIETSAVQPPRNRF